MSYHVTAFVNATDRKGQPLYPNARLVIEHAGWAMMEWETVPSEGEEPFLQRTEININTGSMRPGICGDAEHVAKTLEKRIERTSRINLLRRMNRAAENASRGI